MFELEYMKAYSGFELANALKYNDDSNEIEKYLREHYEFKPKVLAPKAPGRWAPKSTWEEYNFERRKFQRYISEVKSSSKYVLDASAKYVITKNKGKIWVNYISSKKTVSIYDGELVHNPAKFVGCSVNEIFDDILVIHEGTVYIYHLSQGTYQEWSPAYVW